MEEHLGAFISLVGPFSWRACVFYLKGGLKGRWVLTRGQLKLLSDYTSACGIGRFSADGVNLGVRWLHLEECVRRFGRRKRLSFLCG